MAPCFHGAFLPVVGGNKQISTYMRWTGWSQVVISPVKAPIGANMKATSKGARICLGWEAVEGLRGSGT